jgi:chitinase
MKRALCALMLVAILIPAGITRSGATFVAATSNTGSQFTAAVNFNTVVVSLTDPGSPLRGSVPVTATATSGRGILNVVFASAPAGTGTWTTACTKTVAPYTCTFDTTAVADGLRDVRAVATDNAGYTQTSTVTNRRVDNTAPAVAVTDPGSPLTGTVNVTTTATEAGSGLASHTLQYRLGAGAWTDICTQTTSPKVCAWNTTALADGLYDLRTIATDNAGNSATSAIVANRIVDNTAPTVTLTDPGTPVAGSITLASTTGDGAGSGIASVRYEYRTSPAGAWVLACTGATTPFSCAFNTVPVTDGVYDLHAIATDGVGKVTTSATISSRRIDNTAPAVPTLGAVATPTLGTLALTGTASDAGSGVASLKFQYSPAGAGTWTSICTDVVTPYTCSFDTTTVADALYDMRTLATDNAGNTTASVVQTNRRIDNNGPTVALTNPVNGAFIGGTISVTGTATDPAGVTTTSFEYRQGAGAWNNICTDTVTPYTCPGLDSTMIADGVYSGRMTATDSTGKTSISAVISFTVDNTAPTATDVQGANGGTAGKMDAGDTLTFTYSEAMLPSSVLAGWSGASQAVTVRVNNVTNKDTIDVYDAANTTKTNLMSATQALQLDQDWVSTAVVFNATIQRVGSTVVLTFGTLVSGTVRTTVPKGDMTWTPSTAVTDLAGNASTTSAGLKESGAGDIDF